MPESLLTILKFLLLALLYLFFLRVLRAVWAEVHTPRGAPMGSGAAAAASAPAPTRVPVRDRVGGGRDRPPGRLKVLEPAEQRGRAYELGDELTVGRAAGCQVRVDDNYASQLHARIFRRDDQLFVEDLGSTNGTYLNRRGTSSKERVTNVMPLRAGDRLCIGKTVMEVAR
jgi:pSer/pThr/pTyr-binding forkhead associated (FHA) protein